MPKRSFDLSGNAPAGPNATAPTDKVHRKTERSHEENQERAYVAASRRADRSIEARLQSARMASEIHKKRTGKGFKITEDIVMKEEMYEEEDDDMPRSYRLLSSHMQTTSADMNAKLETYLVNKITMSHLVTGTNEEWRGNEINKLFSSTFPFIDHQAQHAHHLAVYHQHGQVPQGQAPQTMNAFCQQPHEAQQTSFHPVNYQPQSSPHVQHVQHTQHMQYTQHSQQHLQHVQLPQQHAPPVAVSPRSYAQHPDMPSPATVSPPAAVSTPGSNPEAYRYGSHSSGSTMAPGTPVQLGSTSSAFTTDLSAETRMLIGDMTMADGYYSGAFNGQDAISPDIFYTASEVSEAFKVEDPQQLMQADFSADFGAEQLSPVTPQAQQPQPANAQSVDEAWETFLNENIWGNDQM